VRTLHTLAAALLALTAPSAARALVVYDTYPLGTGGQQIIVGQFNNKDFQVAYPFEVETAAPLSLVTLRLRHSPSDPLPERGDYTVQVRADDGGEPGAVLESWTTTTVFSNVTDVEFASVVEPVLAPGIYWLNVKCEAGTGSGLWYSAAPVTNEARYAETGALDPVWLTPATPYLLGLATVEVPEPSHAVLALAGAAVLAPFRRRRARG
jgi:hypothetical protein